MHYDKILKSMEAASWSVIVLIIKQSHSSVENNWSFVLLFRVPLVQDCNGGYGSSVNEVNCADGGLFVYHHMDCLLLGGNKNANKSFSDHSS